MLKACVFLFAPVGRVTACSGEAMRYLATGLPQRKTRRKTRMMSVSSFSSM